MESTLRVGIIGCGFIAAYHARAVKAFGHATLAAAASRTQASVDMFASRFDIPVATTDASRLTRAPDIDALVIATPNRYHAPLAIEAMRHGKHVLVEKPMAMNYAEARKMAAVAEETKRCLQIGHMWRFDTEVRYLRDVIRSGRLGTIVKTKGYGIHVNWGPMGWFTKKREAGGGALVDMGVHAIDTASYLLGDPEPVCVYAKIGTFYGAYDVDDTAVVMIEWAGGAVSIIESGWWHPYMDGPEAATQVFGTQGYGRIFPAELHYHEGTAAGVFRPLMPPRPEHCEQGMYDRQMESFLQSALQMTPPHPDGRHGAAIMRILDAAYASSRAGKAVRLAGKNVP
jgi:predicted dehydrogenase